MKNQVLQIFKIGGNVINNDDALNSFLKDFSTIEGPKILIHGGGKKATELSSAMGLQPQMINGRRVTDEATVEVVTMVYAGLLNKKIVAQFKKNKRQLMVWCHERSRQRKIPLSPPRVDPEDRLASLVR